ncbi:Pentalenene oxygenase [Aquisphaera giovannonii]|uniref:Pentalenene oxygenase n=1 Tax=Aquisphaera giovannonii TaxID=406548 RepID=A0A5B9W3A0_9BACT|nr:cytochrome P450 [Aquisphaera giovannonii]QEH35068.1 Pentalenene oxygenase [Aquisphaera giovannonii]
MNATATAGRSVPPGPKQHWLAGNLREFSRDRLGALSRWHRDYGDVVSARFGPRPIVFVNHPDLVETVLVEQNRKFIKHYRLRSATRTLGNGLLTSDGDFWRGQRKLAQPAFHRDRIAGYAGSMVDAATRMLDAWEDGQTRDVQDDMMRLTLEIVLITLFGADSGGASGEASEAMETLANAFIRMTSRLIPVPTWLPTPHNIRTERAARRLDAIILGIIAERRKGGDDRGDLLSMLLQAQDEESGRRMTDAQLRDEAMTLFMAGHETTANTLAWAFCLLAGHPEAEAKLHAELDSVLGGRPPSLADLPRLPYTAAVINETLRVYPTVWMLGREAIEPVELGGYRFPAGVTVFMPQWTIHRDARWFDEPEAFRPGRWEAGRRMLESIPRYAYFPFGGGPRICIGNNFALMESALLLASVAGRYRIRLAPDARIAFLPTMTLRPAHGVRAIVSRR